MLEHNTASDQYTERLATHLILKFLHRVHSIHGCSKVTYEHHDVAGEVKREIVPGTAMQEDNQIWALLPSYLCQSALPPPPPHNEQADTSSLALII